MGNNCGTNGHRSNSPKNVQGGFSAGTSVDMMSDTSAGLATVQPKKFNDLVVIGPNNTVISDGNSDEKKK